MNSSGTVLEHFFGIWAGHNLYLSSLLLQISW